MEEINVFSEPFPHGVIKRVFSSEVASGLADWIGATETWGEKKADSPRRSIYWTAAGAPPPISHLLTPERMQELREQVEHIFRTDFSTIFSVSANRYSAGQGIKIHNDFFPDPAAHPHFFTHRLIAYLSPGVDAGSGGLLGIFERDTPEARVRTVIPTFNSGSVMAMGPRSFHAVSAVKAGVRYSIGFSFVNKTGSY